MTNGINSYVNALFNNIGEPVIFGLTGYTGVGCSTTKRILCNSDKPNIPGYNTVFKKYKIDIMSRMSERGYKKLKYNWKKTSWKSFVSIEAAKIIFGMYISSIINGDVNPTEHEMELLEYANSRQKSLDGLKYFTKANTSNDIKIAQDLITAYDVIREVYQDYKNKFFLKKLGDLIEQLQKDGDELRRYGKIIHKEDANISPEFIFTIPQAIDNLINAYMLTKGTHHFVIDSLKNPFEVEYFRKHFSRFYLIGILRDQSTREKALFRKLDQDAIELIEKREKSEYFDKEGEAYFKSLTSQNIDECIRKADLYIYNQESQSQSYSYLRFGVIKLLTLVNRPGCVTPNQDERCMQLAMTARLVSGCISRQVGAVVIDKTRRVIGVGWNDPPKGQVPCTLRTCNELLNDSTPRVFSENERSKRFVDFLKNSGLGEEPFCFRTEHGKLEKGKAAEYTRALHAEENALFQATMNTSGDIEGATLYTTARTCTLCAKKAYQLGVNRIVYIDEYYDIAIEQTIKSGSRDIIIEKFSGIIGEAYHKLYTSPLPEKELLRINQNLPIGN